ncbi:MAG: DNA primase [Aeriscardovia aeriphila]|nr:DNA primase [Aeriscardovia aeriphila]
MAGRIKQEDIELVRQRADLNEIVSETVQLRRSGAGEYMGLCPFHDEKTPSFAVRPSMGAWHCFGCGKGGDVFGYIEERDSVGFADAVEILADKYGITLHYETPRGNSANPQRLGSPRSRLLQVCEETQKFFADNLFSDEALPARQLLAGRNFTKAQGEEFGCGYAPLGWDNLVRHLASKGFTYKEMVDAGVARQGNNGVYDYFRGRLTWPIRDITGRTLGFGARKLYDEDKIEAKYINTPDTQLYHKDQILFGIDKARESILKTRHVVVVEGYTDVMAMYFAGIKTAVATCGTAFGMNHQKIIRRLVLDDSLSGLAGMSEDSHEGAISPAARIYFTFDGDAAGQKAALRTYQFDSELLTQSYVVVAPDNLDPCDLRLQRGDEAVRALFSTQNTSKPVPLHEYVLRKQLTGYDFSNQLQQRAAVDRGVRIILSVRSSVAREGMLLTISKITGMDRDSVMRIYHSIAGTSANSSNYQWPRRSNASSRVSPWQKALEDASNPAYVSMSNREYFTRLLSSVQQVAMPWSNASGFLVHDALAENEQWVLAGLLQMPQAVNADLWENYMAADLFPHTVFAELFTRLKSLGALPSVGMPIPDWQHAVRKAVGPALEPVVNALIVLRLPLDFDSSSERGVLPGARVGGGPGGRGGAGAAGGRGGSGVAGPGAAGPAVPAGGPGASSAGAAGASAPSQEQISKLRHEQTFPEVSPEQQFWITEQIVALIVTGYAGRIARLKNRMRAASSEEQLQLLQKVNTLETARIQMNAALKQMHIEPQKFDPKLGWLHQVESSIASVQQSQSGASGVPAASVGPAPRTTAGSARVVEAPQPVTPAQQSGNSPVTSGAAQPSDGGQQSDSGQSSEVTVQPIDPNMLPPTFDQDGDEEDIAAF